MSRREEAGKLNSEKYRPGEKDPPGLSFTAARVEVARSGDLALQGTYEFATTDKMGKTTTEKGRIRDNQASRQKIKH